MENQNIVPSILGIIAINILGIVVCLILIFLLVPKIHFTATYDTSSAQQPIVQHSQSNTNNFTKDIEQTRLLWSSGQYDAMTTLAKKAISEAKGDTELANGHYWLGVAYYKNALNSQAEKEELLSISLDPAQSGPYVTLGAIKSAEGDYKQELVYAKKAVSLDTTDPWAHNELAIAYIDNGQKQQGIDEFNKAIQLDPENFTFRQNLNRVAP